MKNILNIAVLIIASWAMPVLGADSTIEGLAAGAAVSGTDLYPTVQPTSPATKVSAGAQKTFMSASPTFTGTVTAPDASVWNSTNLALAPAGTTTNPTLVFTNCGTNCGFYAPASGQWGLSIAGNTRLDYSITSGGLLTVNAGFFVTGGNVTINSTSVLGWNNGATISAPSGAQIQFGPANSSTPVAQILKFQSGSGTNTAGQNSTITGSLSTGTGTDGDIIFQTGIKNGGSNATPATAATAITIKGETQEAIFTAPVRLKGYTVSGLPTGNQGDIAFVTDQLTTCAVAGAALTGGGAKVCPVFFDGSAWVGG